MYSTNAIFPYKIFFMKIFLKLPIKLCYQIFSPTISDVQNIHQRSLCHLAVETCNILHRKHGIFFHKLQIRVILSFQSLTKKSFLKNRFHELALRQTLGFE